MARLTSQLVIRVPDALVRKINARRDRLRAETGIQRISAADVVRAVLEKEFEAELDPGGEPA